MPLTPIDAREIAHHERRHARDADVGRHAARVIAELRQREHRRAEARHQDDLLMRALRDPVEQLDEPRVGRRLGAGALAAHQVAQLAVRLGLDLAAGQVDLHLHLLAGVDRLEREVADLARRRPQRRRARRQRRRRRPSRSGCIATRVGGLHHRAHAPFEAAQRLAHAPDPQSRITVASSSAAPISEISSGSARGSTSVRIGPLGIAGDHDAQAPVAPRALRLLAQLAQRLARSVVVGCGRSTIGDDFA